MCCFSRPVRFVGATRIFARPAGSGRQLLAYSMNVELAEELAMVLPLPVPASPPDDAVSFLDLSGYGELFDDLERAFPPDYTRAPQARGFGPPDKPLVVHDVGDFEASFVPSQADFVRLDPRFRMPESIWSALPGYHDFGFAVFRLKPGKKRLQTVHPMAFSFPTREPDALFFPTVHVHDGAHVPARASFDHMLFCQTDGVLDATLDWTRSSDLLGAHLDASRARGLIDPRAGGRRVSIWGEAPNADVILRPPAGIEVEDLEGEGERHAFRANASHAYAIDPWDEMRRAWQKTARTRMPALCRVLREGLRDLVSASERAWRLAPLTPDLPPHFVNGTQLWTGTDYMNGAPATPGGSGRIAMRIFTQHVEPQDITLGFDALPNQAELDGIRAELARLLDRAVIASGS